MAGDDDEILEVKAKPNLKPSSSARSKTGSPYRGKRPSSAKTSAKSRSARELWLDVVKSGSGGLSSGRRPGQHPGKRTPTEYWMDTLRKSGQGLSTNSTTMNTLTGTKRPPDGVMPFLSTSHYLRQMAGAERTPRKSQDATARTPKGTPFYKSQEEYYEEILELRKQIASLGNDNSLMKSKLRRTEEDNTKKEKEIEKLLDPSKSEEMRRTLADRRPDTGTVIHGLKQKIVRLEQQLKEKEGAHKKLQADMKATRINELQDQLEVFYTEIVRLQQAESGHGNGKGKGEAPAKESKEYAAKVRALNETILRVNDSNTRLQEENKLLRQDLVKHMEKAQVNADLGDGVKQEYVDMNKRQLVGVITKLEKKIEKMDYDNVSLLTDLDKRRDGKAEGKIVLSGSLNERIDQLDKRETELLEERQKLQESVKKAKDDRMHYRKKCEELEKEVKELHKYHADSDVLEGLGRKSVRSSRHSVASDGSARSAAAAALDEVDRDKLADNFQKQRAARVLQRTWKKHHRDQMLKEEEDDAASLIQSTVRGHYARKDHAEQLRKHVDRPHDNQGLIPNRPPATRDVIDLDSVTDDVSIDDDVITIQSAFRGHVGRKDGRLRQSPRKRPGSAKPNRDVDNDLGSDGESLEEENMTTRAMTSPTSSRAMTSPTSSRAAKRPSSVRREHSSTGAFSSPRRRSPSLRERLDENEDDDDIIF